MKRTWWKSLLSLILCFVLLVQMLPLEVLAESIEIPDAPLERPEAAEEMNTVTYQKDATLRQPQNYYAQQEPIGTLVAADENSRTYQISENTFITEIGGESDVYVDSSGEARLVDNSLVQKDPWFVQPYFENRENDYTVQLPMEITENNGVKVSKGDYSLEMIPQGGDFSQIVVAENAALYNNVFDGVDFQYTVLGDSLKEDIVLNKAGAATAFSFELVPGKLEVREADGVITLHDRDGSELFIVSAPAMIDASGVVSLDVTLTLEYTDGKYLVTVTGDPEWLASPDRAYPVRIDPTVNVSGNSVGLYCAEQGSPNTVVGDNNYPYCGYDDGIRSGNLKNYGTAHLMTRTYAKIGYDFSQIPTEAKINSATFSMYHYTAWSRGKTVLGLYQVDQAWDQNRMSWNYQTGFSHTFIEYKDANASAGWVSWNVTDVVNSWVQGIASNNGFVIKAQDERNMQCEVFHNKTHTNKPKLTIEWSIPDPVDPNYGLDQLTIALRPITEKNVDGKLLFDAVFADGVATPGAYVAYRMEPDDVAGSALASASYKYPDSSAFDALFPNGTRYKDKLGNWQTQLFGGLTFDKLYHVAATASKNGETSPEAVSDTFLIYKIKRTDTFPYIANYYGVPLNTIMRDNRVQDTLVVENNTIFIRNPRTNVPYNPAELDDDAKKAIDSALMGRGLHCEYGFEPVNLNTGNFYFAAVDASLTDLNGTFAITRTYNSKADGASSRFGRNWSFGYDESLSVCADGSIAYSVGDGKTLYFLPDGNGGYISPAGYYYTLEKIAYTQGEDTFYRYELRMTDGSRKEFNAWGLLTAVVDGNGFTTAIAYDENFQPKSITSPSGKVFGITCDAMGRITAVTLPNGAVLGYTYDENGNLTAHTDANGNTIRYVYDESHRMTAWYDQENNRIVMNEYDDAGRVLRQTDANGHVVTLAYTENQTTTTDANGNVTVYTYDDQYRTIKIEHPNGKVEEMSYDGNNNLVRDDDYTYTHDASGNVLTETRADGAVRSYVYNAANKVTQITGFDGTVTSMEYSAAGDLVKMIYADGSTETYVYDDQHRVISHTNANGDTETFAYDGAMASSITDFNGNTYQLSYNAMNQLITTTAPDGSVTRTMYNAAGVMIGQQAADGAYTEYSLNKIGNVVRVTDPMGYASDFTYDGMYNVLSGTDPRGGVLSYTYDGNGNTLTETDPEGNVTAYTYDSMNRVVKVVDANGGVTTYTYDLDGNLTGTVNANGGTTATTYDPVLDLPLRSTDALGYVTTYAYDLNGNLLTVNYPDGTSLSYVYDSLGRLVEFTDETGLVSRFTYDGQGNVLKLVENGERVYTYAYDPNGNLLRATDPLGSVVSYEYDSMNRQVRVTNQLGAQTRYGYDAVGRVTRVEDAAGNVVTTAYDLNGNVSKVTAANGGETIYNYDELGNLISQRDALGNITNYAYDKLERLTKVTDALKGVTTYTHDGVSNLTKVTDALGYDASMAYDALGNTLEVRLENGDTTTFVYDAMNRVVETTDAAGLTKRYTYDSMGRVLEATDNTGSRITYVYDDYGRLLSQTDVIGRSEVYTYDAFSQVTSVVGTDKNKTTFTYDALGRLTSVTDAEGKTTAFAYDAAGNLLEQTEADGKVYTYAYDVLNRVVSVVDPLKAETGYTYDSEGNLLSVTDGNGVTVSYAYDKLNRLISVTDGNGNATGYTFDELSRVIAITDPEGGTTEYRYDAIGNLVKSKDANGYVTEFEFDSIGNVTAAVSELGARVSYTYDKHNNLTSVTDALGNVTTYTVDLNGLTTQMVQPNGGTYTYTYDQVHRITGITTPLGYTQEFVYDEFGNLAQEKDNLDRVTSYSYDIMHRITGITDAEGNETAYTYDPSGNLATVLEANGALTSYTYDLLDQITSETDPEGRVTSMQYDMVGNITAVTAPGGRTTRLEYDSNYNLIAVTDPMGYVTTQSFDGNNNVLTLTDALGNTVSYEYDALSQLTRTTDAAGAVVGYEYDAHGNVVGITNPLGGKTVYTYDLADHLIQVTDPMERVTSYTYDVMGNLVSQTDADGKETSYTYDLEGNLTSITDANGRVEQMIYDVAGNLKSIVHPDSTTVAYDYDKLNSLVSKKYSQDNSVVQYLYDNMGNRISMTDSTGETTYSYSLTGQVTSVTSADGKTVRYAYDDCGRLSAITYADGRVVSYGYDLNDRLTTVTDGEDVTAYSYDALGRVVETSRPNGTKTVYTYDVRGNLTELVNTDAEGTVISSFAYTYDLRGYITEEVAKDAETTVTREYHYNLSGELVKFTEQDGLKLATYAYTYDNSGNRIRLEKSGIDQPETITYTYNAANQLISETSTIDGTTYYTYNENGSLISEKTDNQQELTYEYTVEQRLAAIREGGALLMAASYDGDGNRVFQLSRTKTVHYVEKDEVSDAVETPSSPVSGPVGTVGSVESSGSGEGEGIEIDESDLVPIPGVVGSETDSESSEAQQSGIYTYYERVYANPGDSIFWYGFGQGMLQFFSNLNGALSAYLSDWFCHLWDFVTGQYELVVHSEAPATDYADEDVQALRDLGLSEEEIADITGNRLDAVGKAPMGYVSGEAADSKTTGSDTAQSVDPVTGGDSIVIPENPTETERVDYELTYYVNNVNTENTQVLMEYGKRDELKSVYTYGIERISVETIAETVNTQADEIETGYYLYDGRGSVANVVSVEAEVLSAYTYDPFGNVISGAPEFDSFYGYNAEETNPVTGLQYLRARYYDTETGRFNVADTYLGDVSEPLTLNRYTYTVNNPVMHNDPSGHWPNWLDNAVNTVKNGAKKAANWVNDNVVKPVVDTAKSAASWVNDNVIQPGIEKVKNFGNNLFNKAKNTAEKIVQGYQNVKDAASQKIQETKLYIERRTQEIKQHVIEFSCGTAEKLSDAWESTVDWCNNAKDYLWRSMKHLILGGYSGEDATILSIGGSIVAGFFGVDAPLDVRDLIYDITHLKDEDVTGWDVALDIVALLPLIGVIKNVKYADEVAEGVSVIAKNSDEIVEGATEIAKNSDEIVEGATEIIKNSDKALETAGGITKNADEVKHVADGFDDWLTKGPADNKVYFGVKDDAAYYTGITKQTKDARLAQHLRKGKDFDDLDVVFDGLTRNQARALEQYLIENGPDALNKINSIGENNKYYDDAMTWAKQYLDSKGFTLEEIAYVRKAN